MKFCNEDILKTVEAWKMSRLPGETLEKVLS